MGRLLLKTVPCPQYLRADPPVKGLLRRFHSNRDVLSYLCVPDVFFNVNRAPLLTGIFAALCYSTACAQQPFYTDDPGVTDRGKFHFELANEFDVLQTALYP